MSKCLPVVERTGDCAVVSLAGDIDLTVTHEVRDSYERAIARMDVPHLTVDVHDVTFMDSTGVSTLVPALREVEARGGTVSVIGANDRIVKLFRIAHLDAVIST